MERRTRGLDRGLVAMAVCMASVISVGCLTPDEGLEEERTWKGGESVSDGDVASVQQEALHSVLGYFKGPKTGKNYPVYYGAFGDSYDHCTNDGINPATCNGGSNRTGMRWQCVEWAVRFMHFEFGTSKPWGVSAAKYMCGTHPSTVRQISTNSLKPGDLYVNGSGTYGHVAVVKQVNRDSAGTVTSVRTVDQNFYGCGSNCLEGLVYPGQQLCWLRDQANDSTSPPPTCNGPYGQTPFTDICDSPFRDDIEWAYLNNITAGCAADRYCPSANVTRDQMASFLQRKYGFPSTTTNYFDDDNGNSHEGNINRIAAAGVTSGCGTRKYCPADAVSRGQMAAFLGRASKLPAGSKDYFSDDTGHPNEADINRIAEAGISSGCGLNKYCPDSIVTREQMAAFLRRAPKP